MYYFVGLCGLFFSDALVEIVDGLVVFPEMLFVAIDGGGEDIAVADPFFGEGAVHVEGSVLPFSDEVGRDEVFDSGVGLWSLFLQEVIDHY